MNMSNSHYRSRVIEWRKEREESLRKENGWLALCGLYWLKPGINLLGSAQDCDVRLPDRFPSQSGHFEMLEDSVLFHPDLEIKGLAKDNPATDPQLRSDIEANPTFINFERMRMVLIKRGNKFGIRMWDNSRAERSDHAPRTWYEIDEVYRFPAVFHPYTKSTTLKLPDFSGVFMDVEVVGTISFDYRNTSYDLMVSQENDDDLILRFWDESSNSTSYPSGRYMVLHPPKNNGIELDFNFSYNPPCAFTPYATCVFAPQQNRLDFSIHAGETYLQHRITEVH